MKDGVVCENLLAALLIDIEAALAARPASIVATEALCEAIVAVR